MINFREGWRSGSIEGWTIGKPDHSSNLPILLRFIEVTDFETQTLDKEK